MDFFKFRSKKEEPKKMDVQNQVVQPSIQAMSVPESSNLLAQKDRSTVLIRPRVTEKATDATMHGAYVFEVNPRATKKDVADDIRRLYKVSPKKITIVRTRSRDFISRMRNRRGKKGGMKKAIVFLKEGDTIELT
jgi:large subunit ribosomal protein L23